MSAEFLVHASEGTREASVVVESDFVGDIVSAIVHIGIIVRRRRSADQSAGKDVAVGDGVVDVIGQRTVSSTVVGVHRRVFAKTNDITAVVGVVAENVVDLLLSKVGVAIVGVINSVGVDACEEGSVGTISERTPLADPSQSALSFGDAAVRPVVQPAFNIATVLRITRLLGKEDARTIRFVVPGLSPS